MTQQQAIFKRAQKAADQRGETLIVYYDPEWSMWDFTTESHFDILVDTNHAEYSWIEGTVEPKS